MRGHGVLQLPVPVLEDWVVARTRHYDDTFVSADPCFGHAHITVLAPFPTSLSGSDLDGLAAIAATTAPIDVRLARVAQFPDGIIHLVPEPAAPFEALTERVIERFPGHQPYEGRFGPRVAPHLTLDAASDEVTVGSTERALQGIVPAVCHIDTMQLTWWESGACRVLAEWGLAGS